MVESITRILRKRIRASASKFVEKLTNPFTTNEPEVRLQISSPDVSTFQHHYHLLPNIHAFDLNPEPTSPSLENLEHIHRRASEPNIHPSLRTLVTNQKHHILALREALDRAQRENGTLTNQNQLLHLRLERTADMTSTNTALRAEVQSLKASLGTSKRRLRVEIKELTRRVRGLLRREEDLLGIVAEQQGEIEALTERNGVLRAVELFVIGVLSGMDGQGRQAVLVAMERTAAREQLLPGVAGNVRHELE